ncbi:MAG: glycosyltransferase family 9 protein, partial [bacterium]|nr:glycosyltransferase family 9 protein [bacterium]
AAEAVYKRWPVARFAELADLLVERLAARVLIVGDERERALGARLAAAMKRPAVDLCGKLNLLELAALLQESDLMVTNDTGPMHLSAAVGTPVVALFGPTRPSRYGPYGPEGFHVSLQGRASCSPCTRFDCGERTCMNDIAPGQVLEKVASRLTPILEPAL